MLALRAVLLWIAAADVSEKAYQQHFCSIREAFVESVDHHLSEWDAQIDIVKPLSCEKVMEFLYLSRDRIREELTFILGNYTAEEEATRSQPEAGIPYLMSHTSRASSLLAAHTHISGALLHLRAGCLTEHLRLLFMVSLRRMKALLKAEDKQLWFVYQATLPELRRTSLDWLKEAHSLFEADVRTMGSVMSVYAEPEVPETYAVTEADGRWTTLEMLRRQAFEEKENDHLPLSQALLRQVLEVDSRVVDFGAGNGWRASWLNETGLVEGCWAFDGSPDVGLVTRTAVGEAHVGHADVDLSPGGFDWVLALDVGHTMLPEHAEPLVANIARFARRGAVVAWSTTEGTNPLSEKAVRDLLATTALEVDEDATAAVRAAVPKHPSPILVLVTADLKHGTVIGEAVGKGIEREGQIAGCGAEEGALYGGADVMTYNDVPSAQVCCKLCSQHPGCVYWTWSTDVAHENMCWLKSSREHRVPHPNFVSGRSSA